MLLGLIKYIPSGIDLKLSVYYDLYVQYIVINLTMKEKKLKNVLRNVDTICSECSWYHSCIHLKLDVINLNLKPREFLLIL